MLDAYIIDMLRRQEEERRYQQEELVLEMPSDRPDTTPPQPTEDVTRGVVIIEL